MLHPHLVVEALWESNPLSVCGITRTILSSDSNQMQPKPPTTSKVPPLCLVEHDRIGYLRRPLYSGHPLHVRTGNTFLWRKYTRLILHCVWLARKDLNLHTSRWLLQRQLRLHSATDQLLAGLEVVETPPADLETAVLP